MAQPFDSNTEKLSGNPVPVIDDVAYNAAGILASFSLSADGHVAIVQATGANDTRLTWFNRNGEETGLVGLPATTYSPEFPQRRSCRLLAPRRSNWKSRTELPPYIGRSRWTPAAKNHRCPMPRTRRTDRSRDGRWISYGTRDIRVASAAGDRKPSQFLATAFQEGNGRFSPTVDGWRMYPLNGKSLLTPRRR